MAQRIIEREDSRVLTPRYAISWVHPHGFLSSLHTLLHVGQPLLRCCGCRKKNIAGQRTEIMSQDCDGGSCHMPEFNDSIYLVITVCCTVLYTIGIPTLAHLPQDD